MRPVLEEVKDRSSSYHYLHFLNQIDGKIRNIPISLMMNNLENDDRRCATYINKDQRNIKRKPFH